MLRHFIERLATFSTRRPGTVLGAALLIAVLASIAATRLRLDPDMLNFLPSQTREVREFRQVLQALGTLDQHVVAVDVPPGTDAAAYAPLIDILAREYRELAGIRKVDYRLPDLMQSAERLLPKATHFLTPAEARDVADRLSDRAIHEAMATNAALLQTPQSGAWKQWIRLDPLRLHTILLRRLAGAGGGFRFDAASGYFLSADRTTYAMLVRPVRPAHDLPYSAELMRASRDIERRAIAEFRREYPDVPPPSIAYAGGYAIAVDDAELIRKDVIGNVAFSFIGVLLLFVVAFRRFIAVVYAAVPLAWTVILTFAVAALGADALSSAAAGFAALLAGLGIDFITVFYGRTVEERQALAANGSSAVAPALVSAARTTLPGIVVAAVTTSITFYAFLFTEFRGMTQMGWLTGTGILIFLVAVAVILPALIAFVEQRRRGSVAPPALAGFGSGALVRAAIARPRTTIAIWIVVVIASALASLRIEFNDDPANIRALGNRGVDTQERLARTFGQSFDFVLLVTSASSAEQALATSEALVPRLQTLRRDGVIGGFQSLSAIVPSPAAQREALAILRTHAPRPEEVAASIASAAEAAGFRAGAFDDYAEALRTSLATGDPLRIEREDDPALLMLRERFLQRSGAEWLSVTYLYPPHGRWGRSVAPELAALAETPGVTLTGVNVVAGALRRIARADAIRATLAGLVAVFVFFAFVFRSPRTAALMFVPFFAGCIGMTGIMALAGLPFNPINLFVGLMLVAVGTDYAVYMIERYRESPETFTAHAHQTARAVTMAALTTIIGYGSFALSHYPGLRSIGYASTFGVAISGLAAITLLPAILRWRSR